MQIIVVENALKLAVLVENGGGLEEFFVFGKIALDTKVKIYYN